ncbi:MAG: glycoside hydrolase family 38 C-terminal domain-containing protein, partial [Rectinemataceae bacterium]
CSVDAVHAEMLQRYDCIDQLQATLGDDIFKGLETVLQPVPGPSPGPARGPCDAQMLYFENSQDSLPNYQEFDVDFDAVLVNKVNFAKSMIEDYEAGLAHPDLPLAVAAVDQYGRDIPCALIRAAKAYHMDLQDQTLPEVYKVNRCRVGLLLPGFDYGLHVLRLSRSQAVRGLSGRPGNDRIENEFFVVEYCPSDASFTVEDKATGCRHSGVGRVCDSADAGDEYTYSWIEDDRPHGLDPSKVACRDSGRNGLYEELTVDGSIFLPEGLDEDRKTRSPRLVDCPLCIAVRLYPGIARIDFSLEIDNNAKDHRLQVEFPSGVLATACSGSTAFAVTSRPVTLPVPASWVEYPQNSHPTHGFVHAGNAEHGVSIASDSTNEYESLDQGGQTWIRLTLLRCVGWLSRPDLFTRKGNGGWNLPTPGAQCKGPQHFEYAAIYHQGGFLEAGTFAKVDRKQHHVLPRQLRKTEGAVAVAVNALSFVSALPDCVRLSALKLGERGGRLVFRIYSIAGETRRFALRLPEAVVSANSVGLDEHFIEARQLKGHMLEIEIGGGEIQSYELLV